MRITLQRIFIVAVLLAAAGLAAQVPRHARAGVAIVGTCDPAVLQDSVNTILADAAANDAILFNADCRESSPISLASPLTMTIPPGHTLTIDANGHEVVFDGNDQTNAIYVTNLSAGSLTLKGLTFQNGSAPLGAPQNGVGGAVNVNGSTTLTIEDCTFIDNEASGQGGAVTASNGVTVRNSTFTGNHSDVHAGAIFTLGSPTIIDSTFTGNSAPNAGAVLAVNGVTTIRGSTFDQNGAVGVQPTGGYGGAIVVTNSVLYLINSTVTASDSSQSSAIYFSITSTATIVNSTIANNNAPIGILGDGTGLVHLQNTIVFGHQVDVSNIGGSARNSLFITSNFVPSPNDNNIHDDPVIDLLRNNGGRTETMAITSSSLAFDAGDDQFCNAILSDLDANGVDQRGKPRINTCSIGAFEPQPVDLVITKTAPATVLAGSGAGNLTFTVRVTNDGPEWATNIVINEDILALPPGVTVQTVTPTQNSSAGNTFTPTIAPDGIWTIPGPLDPGDWEELSVVLTVSASTADGAVIGNTATLQSVDQPIINPGDDTATAATNVATGADLRVTKTGPGTAIAGTVATYTVTLTNLGPSDASSATLTDVVPAGTTFITADQVLPSPFPFFFGPGPGMIAGGNLPAGGTVSFTVQVFVGADVANGTVLTNTASVTSPVTADPNPNNNSASASMVVGARSDLQLTKTSDATGTVDAGTEVVYTLALKNNGPSVAQSVTVTDVLPAGTTLVNATAPPGWQTSQAGATVTFTKASMAPDETATFTITVTVNSNVGPNTRIKNTATVASATQDPTPANSKSDAMITVSTLADLSIEKSAEPTSVSPGGLLAFKLTVYNDGPSDARGVRVMDVIPAGTTFVSASTSGGGWVVTAKPSPGGTGTVRFSNSQFASGATAELTIVVKVKANVLPGTTIKNTATIESAIQPGSTAPATPDPIGNNTAEVEVPVVPAGAGLQVSAAGGSATVPGAVLAGRG